jgi:hypothetical protein
LTFSTVGYEERRKKNDWYKYECQIEVEEINKALIKSAG